LTELDDAEAILAFGNRGPIILPGNIEILQVDNWPRLCIYGIVVHGYLSPMDS
jgi:hypothetical protein